MRCTQYILTTVEFQSRERWPADGGFQYAHSRDGSGGPEQIFLFCTATRVRTRTQVSRQSVLLPCFLLFSLAVSMILPVNLPCQSEVDTGVLQKCPLPPGSGGERWKVVALGPQT